MKGAKTILALVVVAAALVAALSFLHPRGPQLAGTDSPRSDAATPVPPEEPPPSPVASARSDPLFRTGASHRAEQPARAAPSENSAAGTNKVERLSQIRETFRALAAGDRTNALRTAKQLTDGTERETALLTLVTEWTHGELRSPVVRAEAISEYGLEAGLGLELAKNPELAMLWANELTDASGRAAILQGVAREMVGSDPAAAFALSQEVPESDRRKFANSVFAGWASQDTEAAIQWANQLSDASDRDAAMQAIRSTAPTGIGTALKLQDGYPVVTELIPGGPADLNGQLHVGDRIVALASGSSQFVNVQNLSLQDVVQAIRGAPNTVLQLQIVPADSAPDSAPQTIAIMRDQIKFKPVPPR